jgi:hypothetical protein
MSIIWYILVFVGVIVGLIILALVIILVLLLKYLDGSPQTKEANLASDAGTAKTSAAESKARTSIYVPSMQELERRWQFQNTGDADLPFAVRLKGGAYRWHSANRVQYGPDFYKMFVDGPWKWEAQGRFAGKNINCGHYFGLSVAAANEESQYYGTDLKTAVLIEIEGETSRVLDLTHPEVIKYVFEDFVDSSGVMALFYYPMLQKLIEQSKGGNQVTDYVGWQAKKLGYDGILFYSARAMAYVTKYRFNRNLEWTTYQNAFYEMRRNPALLNVVLFSGVKLVNGIKSIRIGDGSEPMQNPYFRLGTEKVSEMFGRYGEAYQDERNPLTLTRPIYLPDED